MGVRRAGRRDAAVTEFRAIAAGFAGLIQFEARECEVVHVGEPG